VSITLYPSMGSSGTNPAYTAFSGNTVDSFGRLRVSTPYTLFDSQNRYAQDIHYSSSTATGGTVTYVANQSAVALAVTTSSGSTARTQTYRVFPYQPGKSFLTFQTFSMAAAQTNLTQRIGLFDTNNGVYLERAGSTVSFVIRTYTSGAVSNSNSAAQSTWNVDKLDGTGASGITLDLTKTQILFINLEWLGVGIVKCGFVINGIFYTAHQFNNANVQSVVYMQTAILPLRHEIFTTGTTASAATFQQICSTVMSEGGYEQASQQYVARNPSLVTLTAATSFYPIISIRLDSSYLGAVVIPSGISFLPIDAADYEVILVRNATLTGATWAATAIAGNQVDVDVAASGTAITPTVDSIVEAAYASATNQAQPSIVVPTGYNFDLQLGVSLAGVSDTYTLAARTLAGVNKTCVGSLTFYNLTL
jgi:hypothetical protein